MILSRFFGKLFAGYQILKSKAQPSFSQAGEDQIIRYLFNSLGIKNPTYLDIGTNHPFHYNNTFYFYNRGSKGVCIEPDVRFAELIKKHRKEDVFLNAGVGVNGSNEADFYVFPKKYSPWNTFSKEEADKRYSETKIGFSTLKTTLVSVNEVINTHFKSSPNLISIDVEGWDLEILKSINFESFKPEVVCVESVTFSLNNNEKKVEGLTEFMNSVGYFVYADTHINTIFCNTNAFKKSQVVSNI